MFIILQIRETPKSLKNTLSDIIKRPKVLIKKVESENILPFYIMTAYKYRGKVPWKEIEEVSGNLASRAIFEDEKYNTNKTKLKAYVPFVFPKRVLFQSAVSVLEKLQLDPTKMSVTVIDENGCLSDMLESLVMLCSSIRVVTSYAQGYESVRERLFSKYGISVMLSSKVDNSILTSTAVISDKSGDIPLIYYGILFTNEKRKMLNATVLCGFQITLPEELEKLFVPGIDKLTFASALYELCGAKSLENIVYDDMKP